MPKLREPQLRTRLCISIVFVNGEAQRVKEEIKKVNKPYREIFNRGLKELLKEVNK